LSAKTALSLLLASLVPAPALAIDWSTVPGTAIDLLYPGQSSYEWVLTPSEHSGGFKVHEGKTCKECHVGEERTMGALIASGRKNEPAPIPGKPGSIAATVKTAYDDRAFYVHLDFSDAGQPDAGMDKTVPTKVTMMLTERTAQEAGRFGCWTACHEDSTGMPANHGEDRPLYLGRTRTHLSRQGGGDSFKPDETLARLRASGYALEYWQARLSPGAPATAVGGTVFARRVEEPAAPVSAEATYADGTWSVTLSRPLVAGVPFRDLAEGRTYVVGFAIHAGHTARRFHYVSFERSLTLGAGDGDLVALRK